MMNLIRLKPVSLGQRCRHFFELGVFYFVKDNDDGTGMFISEAQLEKGRTMGLIPTELRYNYSDMRVRINDYGN